MDQDFCRSVLKPRHGAGAGENGGIGGGRNHAAGFTHRQIGLERRAQPFFAIGALDKAHGAPAGEADRGIEQVERRRAHFLQGDRGSGEPGGRLEKFGFPREHDRNL
jgi:hypothetical protein